MRFALSALCKRTTREHRGWHQTEIREMCTQIHSIVDSFHGISSTSGARAHDEGSPSKREFRALLGGSLSRRIKHSADLRTDPSQPFDIAFVASDDNLVMQSLRFGSSSPLAPIVAVGGTAASWADHCI